MSVESDLRSYRRSRNIRFGVGVAGYLVAVYVFALCVQLLPKHSPITGVAVLGLASAWCVTSFLVNGHDAWQRIRALKAFALGAGAGVLWSVLTALSQDLAPANDVAQGITLAVTAIVWMSADFALRMVPALRSGDDEGT